MTTTSLGAPLVTLDDNVDLAAKLNAISNWADAYLTTNLVPRCARQVARTTTITVADSDETSVASYNAGSPYNAGGIAYSAGNLTVLVPGLYRWDATALWPATTATHSRDMFIFVDSVRMNQGCNSIKMFDVSGPRPMSAGGLITLTAPSSVMLGLFQNSGSSIAVTPAFFSLSLVA